MNLAVTGRLRARIAPELAAWNAPLPISALLAMGDGFLTAHPRGPVLRWGAESGRPIARYPCPPLFRQQLFALDDGGFAVVGYDNADGVPPPRLVVFDRDGHATTPRMLSAPGAAASYRVAGDGRVLRERYESGTTSLELADPPGQRFFNFAHAASQPGTGRLFLGGPKQLAVLDGGALKTVPAEHTTRMLRVHGETLVRVAQLDGWKQRWFIESWDAASLRLLKTEETAPVRDVAISDEALLVLGRDGALCRGAPPPADPASAERADLLWSLGAGFALAAAGARIAITHASKDAARCNMPEPATAPAPDLRGLTVTYDFVQESYSSYDVFFVQLNGKTAELHNAPTIVGWIDGADAVLLRLLEGEATSWLRLDASTMACTELARGPGVACDGLRRLVTRARGGVLTSVATAGEARPISRTDPAIVRLLAGAPRAPWLVAQRADSLVILDARELTELGRIAMAPERLADATFDGDALCLVDGEGERWIVEGS